jgi:hypothetical protein
MEMRLMTLEVDGGFSNPVVVRAMAIWLVTILAVLLPLTALAARRANLRVPGAWAFGLAVLLVIPTHVARVLIGTWLYQQTTHPTIISVGFWGGSAPVVIPVLAAFSCYLLHAVIKRSRVTAAA